MHIACVCVCVCVFDCILGIVELECQIGPVALVGRHDGLDGQAFDTLAPALAAEHDAVLAAADLASEHREAVQHVALERHALEAELGQLGRQLLAYHALLLLDEVETLGVLALECAQRLEEHAMVRDQSLLHLLAHSLR